jgi:hypothetical protein
VSSRSPGTIAGWRRRGPWESTDVRDGNRIDAEVTGDGVDFDLVAERAVEQLIDAETRQPMNRTITGHGGRAPPGQNTRTLSAESRWPVSLALKIFQPLALARREARPMARITVRLPHSLAECLGRAPQVRRDHCRTAHSSAWASPWSSIIRTARAPGPLAKDRLGRPIDPILPRHEVSQKPGTIQLTPSLSFLSKDP